MASGATRRTIASAKRVFTSTKSCHCVSSKTAFSGAEQMIGHSASSENRWENASTADAVSGTRCTPIPHAAVLDRDVVVKARVAGQLAARPRDPQARTARAEQRAQRRDDAVGRAVLAQLRHVRGRVLVERGSVTDDHQRRTAHPWPLLDVQDAGTAAAEIAELLRPHEHGVLLTFGPDGLYGHPDHIATRALVALAATRLGGPVVLESVWRPRLMGELVAAATARGLPARLWGLDPTAFGVARPTAVEIDVYAVVERKARALSARRTQFAADHLLSALPLDLVARFLGTEARAGSDVGAARLRELLEPPAADR